MTPRRVQFSAQDDARPPGSLRVVPGHRERMQREAKSRFPILSRYFRSSLQALLFGTFASELPNFVLSLLRVDQGHAAMSFPKASLDVDSDVIRFPRFRIEIQACRFVG